MPKSLFAVALLLFAVPLFAQSSQPSGPVRLSVFMTDLSYVESDAVGRDFSGGIGAALEYRWNKKWALELSVAAEENTNSFQRIDSPDVILYDSIQDTTYPIDLIAQYHFQTSSRWHPFIGAGVRHVEGPRELQTRTSAEVEAGVFFDITPRLGLRLEAKRLLRSDGISYDPVTKTSIGLGWRF